MLQAFAGGFSEMVWCGVGSILVWLYPDWFLAPTLYKFAVLGYLVIFLNWVPLLELDGYFLLSDLIQVPDLRPRSMAFIRHDLWHKLRKRERLTKQEIGLALYGILGILFTVYVLYLAIQIWRDIFGPLVTRLWHGGPIARVILGALALVVIGPVIRGGISLVRSLVRRGRAIWSQIKFRLETGWRVEAAELIDALPMFDDVPEDVLSELAGQVGLLTLSRGKAVVRQGERAEAFYVVRKGSLEVVERDLATGNERQLRILGRGEAFGELGLMEGAVRSATVRALDEAEVFVVGKSTFQRLLASMIHVPKFAPSFQEMAELRELPAFSNLESDELSELLEHGGWMNVAPGEAIIEQGEVGDAFYAIKSGQVEVFEDGQQVRTMGPGTHFGEIALLLDVPRTATVQARTPVRAYRLDRNGFDKLVAKAFRKGTLNPIISPDRVQKH
jgi:CRP-like cAMP-binding protein